MREPHQKKDCQKTFHTTDTMDSLPVYRRSPLLSRLDMELTERCSNNCIHCYINLPRDDSKAKKKELPTHKIKDILKQAVSLGCLDVRFTGGEPLLREDFEEIYVFTRKLGLRVSIFTNATLIDQRLCSVFERIPPLQRIEITTYGMDRKTYEHVTRTKGSYHQYKNGINQLLQHSIPFEIKIPYLSCTRHTIKEFEEFTSHLPWDDSNPGHTVFLDLRARRDSKEKNQQIKKLRNTPEQTVKFLSRRKREWLDEMKKFSQKFLEISGKNLFSCGAGIGFGCVDAYGHFQLCMPLRHPDTIYDLKKGTLRDALTRFAPEVRSRKTKNPEYLAHCAKCFISALCQQCPARSWMEFGTLDSRIEYFCRSAHLQAEEIGLLQKGEKAWEIKDWKQRLDYIKL
ncbi:MAG: radical SAM protein [Candidatus Aminicenantes bacterium]|nr:radical SAM protein [Candidatus Aminicenantes bacterium]